MPRHKSGTIVRAKTKEEMGEHDWEKNSADEFIAPNGYVYIVQRFIPITHDDNEHNADAYECKSVQTGELIQLFPSEITTRPRDRGA